MTKRKYCRKSNETPFPSVFVIVGGPASRRGRPAFAKGLRRGRQECPPSVVSYSGEAGSFVLCVPSRSWRESSPPKENLRFLSSFVQSRLGETQFLIGALGRLSLCSLRPLWLISPNPVVLSELGESQFLLLF